MFNDFFQSRIRTLIYNMIKDNFECLDSGKEVYPDMNFVQFILPCFVVSLMQMKFVSDDKMVFYLANFIHELIQQSERSFLSFKETRKFDGLDSLHLGSSNFDFLVEHLKRLGNRYLPSKIIDGMMQSSDHGFGIHYWDKIFMAPLNVFKIGKTGEDIFKRLIFTHLRVIKLVLCASITTLHPEPSGVILPTSLNLTAVELFDIVIVRRKHVLWDSAYEEFAYNILTMVKVKGMSKGALNADFQPKSLWHNTHNFVWKLFQFVNNPASEWKVPRDWGIPLSFPKDSKNLVKQFLKMDLVGFKQALGATVLDENRENMALLSEGEVRKFGRHKCGIDGFKIFKAPCIKQCGQCGKKGKELKMCHVCLEYDDYTDVNWFCGEECEEIALKEFHEEEHCQFIMDKLDM
jgi:hypothetical protein